MQQSRADIPFPHMCQRPNKTKEDLSVILTLMLILPNGFSCRSSLLKSNLKKEQQISPIGVIHFKAQYHTEAIGSAICQPTC